MAFPYDPSENNQYRFFHRLYLEVFARLNMDFSYEVLPLRRCSIEANAGRFDGEPLRVRNYASSYPNLAIVDEPVFENRVSVYASKNLELRDWNSLNDENLAVDYISGSVQSESRLQSLDRLKATTAVKTPEQALLRLLEGRSDAFIDLEARVDEYLDSHPEKYSKIKSLAIIDRHDGFMFLHKSRMDLIESVRKTLKEMKSDGAYKRILMDAMPKYYSRYFGE